MYRERERQRKRERERASERERESERERVRVRKRQIAANHGDRLFWRAAYISVMVANRNRRAVCL